MYSGIQIQPRADTTAKEETAIDALLGCHARIRYFSEMAARLAAAESYPEADIAAAARSIHRYFTVALPLHEADENVSIDPRVQATVPQSRLAEASAEMVRQHAEINVVLRQLIPVWAMLAQAPTRISEFVPEMRERAVRLRELFDTHLRLEEETVFPAIRELLAPAQLTDIHQEMRERRQ